MEVIVAIHAVLVVLSAVWLFSISLDIVWAMQQISANSSKVVERELERCFLVRESNIDAGIERKVSPGEAMAVYKLCKVDSVVKNDIGVIRIKLAGDHYLVGYQTREICRKQLAPHLHERYLGIEELMGIDDDQVMAA